MNLSLLQFGAFIFLGVIVGSFGTMIGVGGGFLLVPVLLWMFPFQPPEVIASISLAVVFFNALSGSIAYGRMRRIEYKSGLLFSIAAIPGAILGALLTAYIPRRIFDLIIGLLLIIASIALIFRDNKPQQPKLQDEKGKMKITLTDTTGLVHTFSFNPWLGITLSVVVGYISSLLGIGGGIIHVPALVHLLNFPVHIATATSHFMLALMAFSGSIAHLISGELRYGLILILPISIGVIVGAQIGAKLSNRLRGVWIIRLLALALLFVGLRTIWSVFVL